MIERILPPGVACAAACADEPDAYLFPAEIALLGRSVDSRVREFATARHCARRALAALGVPPAPILRGAKREPLWPVGIVGSITHCDGYRAAAAARVADMLTIGIDAEPHRPLPVGVAGHVLDDAERAWLARAPAGIHAGIPAGVPAGFHWDRVMFSAKESVYKAWFPLAGRWLGFRDARVTLEPAAGIFHVELLVPGHDIGLTGFAGRFLIAEGLVLTAIAVPR